ncbi:MAG: cell division ATPase MinD [Nanoarchaeota archaeon]|nr:cell division ATPase MinD [Nanoarchaeota archaeon]
MTLIASVSSSKGGSGKSTTSINLGVALSSFGKDVTIIDANLSTPYLSMYLGAPDVPITLHHVLSGNAHIKEAIYEHSSGAKIIPGCISSHENFDKLSLDDLQSHLKHLNSDIVVLDGAPGLDGEAKSAIALSHEVLAVTTPELPSVAHCLKTVRMAEKMDKRISGIVLTRAGHETDIKRTNVETILEHPVIGIVPEDDYMKKAAMKREPVLSVFPNSPSAIAYHNLAGYLIGNKHMLEMKSYVNPENAGIKILRWALGIKK